MGSTVFEHSKTLGPHFWGFYSSLQHSKSCRLAWLQCLTNFRLVPFSYLYFVAKCYGYYNITILYVTTSSKSHGSYRLLLSMCTFLQTFAVRLWQHGCVGHYVWLNLPTSNCSGPGPLFLALFILRLLPFTIRLRERGLDQGSSWFD